MPMTGSRDSDDKGRSDAPPPRSCLYVPASNPRAIEKARDLPADVVILDLEDAVAPDAKTDARIAACWEIARGGFGTRALVIRINPLPSIWGMDDLHAAVQSGAHALLVPKVTCAADIRAIDAAMTAAGAPGEMELWAMIEMPLAILNIAEITAGAGQSRLSAFVIGINDLAKETGAMMTADRAAFQSALQMTITAARAYGLTAIDGVFNDISDRAGLESECQQGRMLGYDGKSVIHPDQIEICNRIFSPSPGEVEQARMIIAAFADPHNDGQAVLKVGGIMTERLHWEQAKRIVAIAERIKRLTE